MAKIQFKGKVETVYHADDTIDYKYIRVPELSRSHCDMRAFRTHPKYGSYANSDLFKGILNRIRVSFFGGSILRLNNIPEGVTVDTDSFLAIVTLNV